MGIHKSKPTPIFFQKTTKKEYKLIMATTVFLSPYFHTTQSKFSESQTTQTSDFYLEGCIVNVNANNANCTLTLTAGVLLFYLNTDASLTARGCPVTYESAICPICNNKSPRFPGMNSQQKWRSFDISASVRYNLFYQQKLVRKPEHLNQ